jgi:tetratricopeptide (TPR) repeat protein
MLARNDLHGAETCYRQAVALDSLDALVHVNLAFILLQQQRHDETLTELTSALAIDPGNADAHYLLGGLQERHFDVARAAVHFQRAFELNPEFELACRDACRVLFQLGQIASARNLIAAGLALNPTFADFHFYEGNLHFSNDALDSALESYREALALGADYSALHGFIGGILLKRNDIGSALVHLQRAIELDNDNTEAHHDLGVVQIRLGNVEEAIQHQEIVIAQDPGQLQAYSCLLFALGSSVECTPQQYLKVATAYATPPA